MLSLVFWNDHTWDKDILYYWNSPNWNRKMVIKRTKCWTLKFVANKATRTLCCVDYCEMIILVTRTFGIIEITQFGLEQVGEFEKEKLNTWICWRHRNRYIMLSLVIWNDHTWDKDILEYWNSTIRIGTKLVTKREQNVKDMNFL